MGYKVKDQNMCIFLSLGHNDMETTERKAVKYYLFKAKWLDFEE